MRKFAPAAPNSIGSLAISKPIERLCSTWIWNPCQACGKSLYPGFVLQMSESISFGWAEAQDPLGSHARRPLEQR